MMMERKVFYDQINTILDESGVPIGHKRRIFLAISWKKYERKLHMHLSDYKDFGEIIFKMKKARTYIKYRMCVTNGVFY